MPYRTNNNDRFRDAALPIFLSLMPVKGTDRRNKVVMKVLLSIKPEYAFKIVEGSKKFEFRKTIFKNPNIKTAVVYASSPVQKVLESLR